MYYLDAKRIADQLRQRAEQAEKRAEQALRCSLSFVWAFFAYG